MLAPAPSSFRNAENPFVVPGPVGAVLGLPAGAVAALVAWAFGGSPVAGAVFAAAAAATIAALSTAAGALGAAALCWACADGFVLNRFGVLGGGRTDLVALAVVAGAATLAFAAATVLRGRRQGRA